MNRTVRMTMAAAFLLATAGVSFGQQMIYMYPGMQPGGYRVAQAAPVPAPAVQFAPPAAPAASCTSCGEAAACKPAGCDQCCYCNWQVFGEFLYLRPRSVDIAFAVPFDGAINPGGVPVQTGRTGIVEADYEPAFRIGFGHALDDCANLSIAYSRLESESSDGLLASARNPLLRSMVLHPGTPDAAADYTAARARQDIDYDLVDADYRHIFFHNGRYCLNYLIGLRYAHLDQTFHGLFEGQVDEFVNTKINFDGGGVRLGLEGERHAACSGVFVYGKSAASFVGGEFKANYLQGSNQDPLIANTSWEAGRLISMLDLELGAGWTNCNGRLRLSAGYMVSGWFNVVKTADYIRGVQANDYRGLDQASDNTITFDGFVTRAEVRW